MTNNQRCTKSAYATCETAKRAIKTKPRLHAPYYCANCQMWHVRGMERNRPHASSH